MAITKTEIRNFNGQIVAFVEFNDTTGDKTLRAFSGMILGYYRKSDNTTREFSGKIVAKGDALSMLIPNEIK